MTRRLVPSARAYLLRQSGVDDDTIRRVLLSEYHDVLLTGEAIERAIEQSRTAYRLVRVGRSLPPISARLMNR
jgi:predicted DCC family thiol-disulfide oxidoreductase YuxK